MVWYGERWRSQQELPGVWPDQLMVEVALTNKENVGCASCGEGQQLDGCEAGGEFWVQLWLET